MKKVKRIKRPPRRITPRHRAEEKTLKSKTVVKKVAPNPRREIVTPDGLLNEVAAAKRAGKSPSTLQNRRSLGMPPEHEHRGRFVFYRPEAIDAVWGSKKRQL
ncbi:hypothetical protein [Sulfitobacter noctilucae]|uniref:hypothetical protein n=1 Tax=Sulfitobacter noctilucae TaxID=1342302 RepID=UPI000468F2F9|nr:hypothetical protein [Sulfitobacter noctilucae]